MELMLHWEEECFRSESRLVMEVEIEAAAAAADTAGEAAVLLRIQAYMRRPLKKRLEGANC